MLQHPPDEKPSTSFASRNDTMSLDVVRPKDVPRGRVLCEKDYQQSLIANDIEGARPEFMLRSLHRDGAPVKEPVKGSTSRKHPELNKVKDLSLSTHDVDGAQPKVQIFTTTRNTNPLTPRYNLQSTEYTPAPPNPMRSHDGTLRETMDFKASSSSRFPVRDYHRDPADGRDIELSQPNIKGRVNYPTPREDLKRTLEKSGERILSGKCYATGRHVMQPEYLAWTAEWPQYTADHQRSAQCCIAPMAATNIKVYIRVRPGKAAEGFKADTERGVLSFNLPDNASDYYVNNQKTTHTFQFDGVLGMQIKQQEVLDAVARPVIQDVLNGVNGTIFAYGQTGSGKTFTITGGTEHYEDRGLIPRTLRLMFEEFRKGPAQYRMYISYLEIYQDSGYDLLRDDSVRNLQDLPKDEDGNMHLRNLSVNLAASEEDALNLLFLGDTNRVVAETPMNDASTRSHCLFIIWVDSTQEGSDVVRRSKLHLVDLAGSERVSQTGVNGKLLQEAKAINVSLHYLERVIVALHARSKGTQAHVPYRDSMMTSVLRDSLGGNCKTTMVGCIAAEASNIYESMSTCRFAQRVAQITNTARVNEELDPSLLIARLKKEVSDLKQEVKVARMNKEGEEPEATSAFLHHAA
eukprot:symbB.v1.2.004738.t1/scaffold275.1/size244369/8